MASRVIQLIRSTFVLRTILLLVSNSLNVGISEPFQRTAATEPVRSKRTPSPLSAQMKTLIIPELIPFAAAGGAAFLVIAGIYSYNNRRRRKGPRDIHGPEIDAERCDLYKRGIFIERLYGMHKSKDDTVA